MSMANGKTVSRPFAAVLEKVELALKDEGFGVLCRIDVQATLKEKLGEDLPPLVILGACNPPLAHRALAAEPQVAVMLPCNVVVREIEPGRVRVDAINATAMAHMFPGRALDAIAAEVNTRLLRVLDAL